MASTWDDERKAIESYFETNWFDATPIKWEGIDGWIQPGTQNTTPKPWVALFVRPVAAGRGSIGTDSPLRRFIGTIVVQIFIPVGIGTAKGRQLADNVAEIFRDTTLTCGNTGKIFIGGQHDGAFNTEPNINVIGDNGTGWCQFNVNIRYRRDDFF